MINHVVMFKCSNEEDAAELQRRLQTLPDKIDIIKHYEVGLNIIKAERNFDVVLISKFATLSDLDSYSKNPSHLEVLKYILSVTTDIKAVDYES